MKKLSIVLGVAVLLSFSNIAFAKTHICTTKADSTKFIQDSTKFECTGIQNKSITMKDINNEGYEVVSITVNNYVSGSYNYTDWAIVIKK